MPTYKIIVAYDGMDFYGWQIQPNDITIVSTLQGTFHALFADNVIITGASRTDAGVHALGQVARFSSNISITCERMKCAWNNALPKSILIRDIQKVDYLFNPRKNVAQKTYYYHLFYKKPLPIVSRYGWYFDYTDKVDWDQFHIILQLYKGQHDFASFCKVDEKGSTVRTVDSITTENVKRFGCLRITIRGRGFLRFQIRRMIGYALDVARRPDLSVDYIQHLLDTPNARQTLLKADGCGLMLRKIVYKEEGL